MMNLRLFISVIPFYFLGLDLLSQISSGQSNNTANSNTTNKIKIPSHIDIESQLLKEELACIKKTRITNASNITLTNVTETNP